MLLGTLTVCGLLSHPEPGPVVGLYGRGAAEGTQVSHQDLGWLPDVYSLVDRREYETAGDLLFDKVDDLLSAGDLRRCDEMLQMVDVKRLDTNLMISFLAVTLAAKLELPSRAALVRRIEAKLEELAPERVESLLRTLR